MAYQSGKNNSLQFTLDLMADDIKHGDGLMTGDGLLTGDMGGCRDGDEDSSQFSMSPREQHDEETEMCLRMFEAWTHTRQTDFVEQVIARLSFSQHEHLYSILMPMLQRDFITVLPSECVCVC